MGQILWATETILAIVLTDMVMWDYSQAPPPSEPGGFILTAYFWRKQHKAPQTGSWY